MGRKKVLARLNICPTGIDDPETLAALQQEAEQNGANFTTALTRSVTHLICTKAGSRKHRQVCQWNLLTPDRPVHIVRPSWLAACSSAKARVPTDAHSLPPLAGLEVCCSGTGIDVKQDISRICADLGACYTKSLSLSCTHLICEEPFGKKYTFALQSNTMFVVKPGWIFACDRLKSLVDESLYMFAKGGHALGEDDSRDKPPENLPHGDQHAQKNQDLPDAVVTGHAETNQNVNGVKGATDATNSREPRVLQNNTHTASNAEDENRTSDHAAEALPTKRMTPLKQSDAMLQNPSWMDATPGLFLDAFTFYLTPCSFPDKTMHAPLRAKALNLLSYGGGSLSEELTPRVNYVVIIRRPIVPAKIPEIEHAQKMGATLVSLRWLENCVVQQQLLEHDNPPLSEWVPDDASSQVENGSQAQHHADFESSLFQGMRCALGPLALYDSGTVTAVRQKLQRGRGKVLVHDGRGVVSSGVATHVVCGDSLSAGAKRLVEAARAKNSHVVVVTVDWIDACLHRERLVRVDDCVLFSPVPHDTPLRDMLRSKVSLTITGHQDMDEILNARRDVLARLARLLGAGYSERMTKGKTTHLIADGRSGSKSNKVAMAKRWGIFIVNFKWLLACAQTGVVVDPTDFPVKQDFETPQRTVVEVEENGDEDEKEVPRSVRTQSAETPRRRRRDLESTKKSLFKSPTVSRRSPRIKEKEEQRAETEIEPTAEAGDKLFERFTAGLLKSSAGAGGKEKDVLSPPPTRRRSARSPSVSLEIPDEGQKQWSLDASQSQVIVHRDLTPPPTPGRGIHTRSLPPRAAKRRRVG